MRRGTGSFGSGAPRTNDSCKVEEKVLNIEEECKLRSNVSRDQKVRVVVLNARSIVNMKKRLELEVIVKRFGYKIIAVTDSWATPEINDCELGLEGFVLFHKDRNEIRDGNGGGVLLYVSNDIKCVAIDKLNHLKCESLWVELKEVLILLWGCVIGASQRQTVK